MTDATIRPGWSKTRYDRAIVSPLHLRDPITRRVKVVETDKFKSSLVKFSARLELPPGSVRDLNWPTWDGQESGESGENGGSDMEELPPAKKAKVEVQAAVVEVKVQQPAAEPVKATVTDH